MDPKALSNLDPKLRETYERVMGTSSAGPADSSTAPAPSAPVQADGGAPSQVTATATVTTPDGTVAQASSPLSPPPAQPVNPWQGQPAAAASPNPFTPTGQSLPSPAAVAGSKESSPMLRVLYIIGAVVFFALYTIFWIKVFKLPFLF